MFLKAGCTITRFTYSEIQVSTWLLNYIIVNREPFSPEYRKWFTFPLVWNYYTSNKTFRLSEEFPPFFNQSKFKPKAIVTGSCTFSCALRQRRVIALSFYWFIGLHWFWFHDTQTHSIILFDTLHDNTFFQRKNKWFLNNTIKRILTHLAFLLPHLNPVALPQRFFFPVFLLRSAWAPRPLILHAPALKTHQENEKTLSWDKGINPAFGIENRISSLAVAKQLE